MSTKKNTKKTAAFSPEQARRFYDRFGIKQDSQAFYENPALNKLVQFGEFEKAHDIVEFGCGTGRFALKNYLLHCSIFGLTCIKKGANRISRRYNLHTCSCTS